MSFEHHANGYFWNGEQWIPEQPYVPAPVQQQTPPLAWISLLLSAIGFFIVPIAFSLAGVITGHLAFAKGRNDPYRYKTGAAVASLIVGYLGLAYGVVVLAILFN